MNDASIRIGVLGGLHVGKSELVHMICHPNSDHPAGKSEWSGPSVDVVDFERSNGKGSTWVEFLVFPSETKHAYSRQMLYSIGIDALFLVCDCTASRSFLHASGWLEEARGVEGLAGVPIAIILGGPLAVDWPSNTAISQLVEPLVKTYNARVINLSGFLSSRKLEPRQRLLLAEFYECILDRKLEHAIAI